MELIRSMSTGNVILVVYIIGTSFGIRLKEETVGVDESPGFRKKSQ